MRRKRASKRRWIARLRLGKSVPKTAILEHHLDKRFKLVPRDGWSEFYVTC